MAPTKKFTSFFSNFLGLIYLFFYTFLFFILTYLFYTYFFVTVTLTFEQKSSVLIVAGDDGWQCINTQEKETR